MPFELGRALLLADAVAPPALAEALLFSATRGVALPRALLAVGAIERTRLDEELARTDAPLVRHVAPAVALLAKLPDGMCDRLLALPLREQDGVVDVAVVDARDPHAGRELGHFLGSRVRVVRATLAAMESALERMKGDVGRGIRPLAPPIWVPGAPASRDRSLSRTPLYGTPAVRDPAIADAEAAADAAGDAMNIPIPLAARRIAPVQIVEIDGASVVVGSPHPPEPDVVVDLRRPKAQAQAQAPKDDSPPTARGPFSGARAMGNTPAPRLDQATDRDAVVAAIIHDAHAIVARVAVFAIRRDELHGWACDDAFGDPGALRALRVAVGATGLFARALTGGAQVGRLAHSDALLPLIAVMRALPQEIVVSVVRVEGRPALLILGCDLLDRANGPTRLEELARASGDALARVLLSRSR